MMPIRVSGTIFISTTSSTFPFFVKQLTLIEISPSFTVRMPEEGFKGEQSFVSLLTDVVMN